jgi:hypothetical protein
LYKLGSYKKELAVRKRLRRWSNGPFFF